MLLDTPACNLGWQAPNFTLPDLDGNAVSSAQSYGRNGLLVAFICNHCPYVKTIIDRFVADAALLMDEDINILAVMPNDFQTHPEDSPKNMQTFARRHNFSFPYLLDQDQTTARAFDAVCTPDFFGFNRAGELHYRGRLDNIGMKDSAATVDRKPELLEAMRLIAKTGKGPEKQMPSMGCSIKWKP